MTTFSASLSKTFAYFTDFEKYRQRYYRYCSRLDVIESYDNIVITEELWNMTPNTEFDHVKIKVKYTIIPQSEVQWEILEGFGAGTKNKFAFQKIDENRTRVDEHYVPLEIFAKLVGNPNDRLVMHMDDHFMWRNMKLLEGKQGPYEKGDPCPFCANGKLTYNPRKERTEPKNRIYETERFLCDTCSKVATSHKIHVTESRTITSRVNLSNYKTENPAG